METTTPISSLGCTYSDIINHHKKIVYDKYIQERIAHPKKKVSQIASSLGISHSTITRYGHDLGVPKRSTRALTSEQKSDIQLKAAYTKRLNREYKQKLSELSSSPISTEEFSQQVLELKQNVTKNRNQFRQQLSEQNSTLGTSTADSSVLSSNAVRSTGDNTKHRKRGGAGPPIMDNRPMASIQGESDDAYIERINKTIGMIN
jgi:ParB-like chromosome segregation protein Spo0J